MGDNLSFGGGPSQGTENLASSKHSNTLIYKAELNSGAKGHFEASLSSKVLTQPLRSAWEDDTCLGRQSQATRARK